MEDPVYDILYVSEQKAFSLQNFRNADNKLLCEYCAWTLFVTAAVAFLPLYYIVRNRCYTVFASSWYIPLWIISELNINASIVCTYRLKILHEKIFNIYSILVGNRRNKPNRNYRQTQRRVYAYSNFNETKKKQIISQQKNNFGFFRQVRLKQQLTVKFFVYYLFKQNTKVPGIL